MYTNDSNAVTKTSDSFHPYIIFNDGSIFTHLNVVINKANAKSFGKDIAFNLIYVEQHSSV